ncbi:hypothetical protein [Marinobacter daqiaonensis]|nr:hypothetical protein [Marinobacter daqiaonensis]
MTPKSLFLSLLALTALTLTGCSDPETPQEVTRAFWDAVIEGDAETAAELSTLVEESGFDAYSLNWEGASVSWGRVTVDAGQARIATEINGLKALDGSALETTTHVIQINDQWLVDYHRTGDEIASDASIGRLMGQFRDFGEKLRSRFADESDRAARELNRLADDLAALSDQAEKEMSGLIRQYGEDLEAKMEELSRSLDEALEQNRDASPEDRKKLEEARKELERQQERLDESEADSVAGVSQQLARIQQQLSELSGQTFEAFQQEWQRWSENLSRDLEQLNRESRKHHPDSI